MKVKDLDVIVDFICSDEEMEKFKEEHDQLKKYFQKRDLSVEQAAVVMAMLINNIRSKVLKKGKKIKENIADIEIRAKLSKISDELLQEIHEGISKYFPHLPPEELPMPLSGVVRVDVAEPADPKKIQIPRHLASKDIH